MRKVNLKQSKNNLFVNVAYLTEVDQKAYKNYTYGRASELKDV